MNFYSIQSLYHPPDANVWLSSWRERCQQAIDGRGSEIAMRLFNEGTFLLFKAGYRSSAYDICRSTYESYLAHSEQSLSRLALQCGINSLRSLSRTMELSVFSEIASDFEQSSIAAISSFSPIELSKLQLSLYTEVATRIRHSAVSRGEYASAANYLQYEWVHSSLEAKILDAENWLEHMLRKDMDGQDEIIHFFWANENARVPQLLIYLFRTEFFHRGTFDQLCNWIDALESPRPKYHAQLIDACIRDLGTRRLPSHWVNKSEQHFGCDTRNSIACVEASRISNTNSEIVCTILDQLLRALAGDQQ